MIGCIDNCIDDVPCHESPAITFAAISPYSCYDVGKEFHQGDPPMAGTFFVDVVDA
jgi:hypothetical protein